MIRRGKRAQSAVEVSVLIFLIAVALVGYIILLPAEERNQLLETNVETDGSSSVSSSLTLLSESPGKVSSSKSTTQSRELEPMRLYSNTQSNSKKLVSSIAVSRNILQNNYKVITFDTNNYADLEKTQLLFFIKESKGILTITLNEHIIFEGELTSNELPLDLPLNYISDNENVLKLSTNLGWNVFSSNYYLLQDVQLIEDYTVADTSSSRTFSVDSPSEVNLAELNYFITCNSDKEGILTIYLNSHEVFSDQIFCEYLNERELGLDEDYLRTSNTIKFEITQGDYNVEELSVEIKTKTSDYPSFTFNIDSDLYQEIYIGDKDVYLKMTFSDSDTLKEGTIYVQEYSFGLSTENGDYEKKISSYIDDGANTITLQATTDFEIDNLKVYVK